MSATINGEFHLSETWVIQGYARDHQTLPMDLTGSNVAFRVTHSNGELVLDLSTPSGGTVTSTSNGEYEFIISPVMQSTANVIPGAYKYEVQVLLASGRVSTQNVGNLRIKSSLFQ